MARLNLVKALNLALLQEMERDEDIVIEHNSALDRTDG